MIASELSSSLVVESIANGRFTSSFGNRESFLADLQENPTEHIEYNEASQIIRTLDQNFDVAAFCDVLEANYKKDCEERKISSGRPSVIRTLLPKPETAGISSVPMKPPMLQQI